MPELPEVETVMRGLAARLEGRTIVRARVNRPDLRWPMPAGLAARLTGAQVLSFRRRAKYILMRLSGGDSVLLHLGMSGRMLIGPNRPNQETLHEHVVLETDEGWRVGFVDPRRFGRCLCGGLVEQRDNSCFLPGGQLGRVKDRIG